MSKASNRADRKQARKDNPILAFTTDDISVMDDEERAAPTSSGAGRSLLIRLFKWDEVALTPQGKETFLRGAFTTDPTSVLIESQAHGGSIVGKGEELLDDGIGPLLRAKVSATTDGNDLLTLIRDGVLKAASVVFRPTQSRQRSDGVIERIKADLKKVAILPSGAYPSAEVLAVRSEVVSDEVQTPEVTEPAAPAIDLAPIYQRFDAMDEAIAKVATAASIPGIAATSELARYDSFAEAFMAATTDPKVAGELHRVLADNVLDPDNAGLNQPTWLGRIVDRIGFGRPSVTAFGVESPGASGMTVNWPVFDDTSTFTVDTQAAEKDEVSTGVTKYKVGTVDLVTIAGGSDNSLQLLERSQPSFRELLLRQYGIEYGIKSEALMVAALEAGGTAFADGLDLTGATTDAKQTAILQALFGASMAVETATGLPANVVLAASDVFAAIGGVPLMPPQYGTVNTAGTASAASLRINASGLDIIHARSLTAGKMVVAQSDAATFFEDGPRTIEALNVSKLGRDVAIYGFVAPVVLRAGGVQVVTVTLPV